MAPWLHMRATFSVRASVQPSPAEEGEGRTFYSPLQAPKRTARLCLAYSKAEGNLASVQLLLGAGGGLT